MEERAELLVVDDDPESLGILQRLFAADGYRVSCASGGREALERIAREQPGCVVLDYAMPDFSGFEVLRRLREGGDQTPVVVLSTKRDPYDKIAGYSSGADVYVGKDEDPGVLRAAVRRLLSRSQPGSGRIERGGLVLDPATWSCTVDGREVKLPPRLFRLLLALAGQPGRVVRKEQLVYQVWGINSDIYNRAADNAVVELRRLLGDSSQEPRFLHTVRGVGYKFEVEP